MGWLKKRLRKLDIDIDGINIYKAKQAFRSIRDWIHNRNHRNDYEDLSRGLSRRHLVGSTGFSRYVTPLGVRGGSNSARNVVGNTNFVRYGYG